MWKWWQLVYLFFLCLCAEVSNEKTALDTPFNIMLYHIFRKIPYNIFGSTGLEGGKYMQLARNAQTVQQVVPDHIPFPCNITGGRSEKVPNSVHKLRPGDIDVIASIGDSLMAGAGIFADNVFQILIENRGVSAATGGQGTWRQYLTIANIIKEYNPNLIGYAVKDALVSHEASELNVAESGATSSDMPYMTEVLVKRIQRHPKIDVKKHWKMIVFMIGANDFCTEMCWVSSPWDILENHKNDLLQVLRILRDNLPRTYVVLIPPPHLKILVDGINNMKDPSFKCIVTTDVECSCMFGLKYRNFREEYYEIIRRWYLLEEEIANYSEFQKDDFTIAFQPLWMNITIPLTPDGHTDMTYLSNDCFHITQKTNARFANILWNSLFEPINEKKENWPDLFKRFLCPTPERPYFVTIQNSEEQIP